MEGRFDKSNNKLLCDIKAILTKLANKPEIESLDPIALCIDGSITGYIAFQTDEETNAIIEVYFDPIFNQIPDKPEGEACVAKDDFEFKFFETEKCLSDGTKVIEVLCIVYAEGVEINNSTFWIINGIKVDIIPPGIMDCIICAPSEESFLGNNPTLTSFNEITLFIPKCCEVTYSTSAGSVTLPSYKTNWVFNTSFDCMVSDFVLDSECEFTTILKKRI